MYLTSEGFNFPRLIDDDFFSAIKLLWNAKKYISSLTLLFTAIDTFGFIEFGAQNNSFIQWLDEYGDLRSINVTSREIWELRNSLLHMTNLDSYRVQSGSVERLIPAFTHPSMKTLPPDGNAKNFHVSQFLLIILPKGIEKWLTTYNQKREKIQQFIYRYDTIVSEARMGKYFNSSAGRRSR